MTEAELRSELGVDKFGPLRKLHRRISDVFQNGPEKMGMRATSTRAATGAMAEEACVRSPQTHAYVGTNVSTESQVLLSSVDLQRTHTGSRYTPAVPNRAVVPGVCVATVSLSALKPPANGAVTERSKNAVRTLFRTLCMRPRSIGSLLNAQTPIESFKGA
jgi:hypothetical protein